MKNKPVSEKHGFDYHDIIIAEASKVLINSVNIAEMVSIRLTIICFPTESIVFSPVS